MPAQMKQKYDLAIPLGEACSATETLREAGFQFLSFPFDWISPDNSGGDLSQHDFAHRARQLAGRFRDWFLKKDLRFIGHPPGGRKDIYANRSNGLVFNHDFLHGVDFDTAYAEIRARYRRRADRLLEILDSASRILIVRVERPGEKLIRPFPTPVEDCLEVRRILSDAFPGKTFDIFLFAFDRGRAEKDAVEETLAPGITRLAFDYHNYAPGFLEYAVRVDRTAAILRSRFRIVDYRTRGERMAWLKRRILKALRLSRLVSAART